MRIQHLSLTNFRNYSRLELDFPAGVVLLQGDNAQGKTNLLEAIYLLSRMRSPRTSTERAVEQLGRAHAGPRAKRAAARAATATDPNLERVLDGLRQRFQTRVRIQGDARRGRVEIEYFGDGDLQRITAILLGDV